MRNQIHDELSIDDLDEVSGGFVILPGPITFPDPGPGPVVPGGHHHHHHHPGGPGPFPVPVPFPQPYLL
jgi:hypothetical protein